MADEVWRDVVGYEGIYQVSNMGRIRSLDRFVVSKIGTKRFFRGKIIKQGANPISGYMQVGLRKNGKHRTVRVHQIVAQAFLKNDQKLSDVDHINSDKSDNRAENLRYVTHADNMRFARENGRFDLAKMADRMRSKEMQELAAASHRKPVIRDDGVRFESINDAARSMGCHSSAVGNHLRGKTKTCMGRTFRYA